MDSSITESGQNHCSKQDSVKNHNSIANSVNPDETAQYEPSHLDLSCLGRYLYWTAGLKG